MSRLLALGIKLVPLPPIAEGACQAARPFRITEVPGPVTLTPAAIVVCPVAEALVRWTTEAVAPEAQRHLGTAPKTVQIGTSYQCRGQNRQANAKLSEHAFANAVDVMGFSFQKGPPVVVGSQTPDTPAARFVAAVRSRACDHFATVLGPGQPYHADHLHLDLRGRKGTARLCQ